MSRLRLTVRRRHWLVGGLVVSLALNAFLIGAAATDIARRASERDKRPVHFELRWLEGRLREEGFDRVAAAVEAARPEIRSHIDRLKARRAELGSLVAKADPDRAAIDAKLAEIRANVDLMLAHVQQTTVSELLALPAEMRADLAEPDDN